MGGAMKRLSMRLCSRLCSARRRVPQGRCAWTYSGCQLSPGGKRLLHDRQYCSMLVHCTAVRRPTVHGTDSRDGIFKTTVASMVGRRNSRSKLKLACSLAPAREGLFRPYGVWCGRARRGARAREIASDLSDLYLSTVLRTELHHGTAHRVHTYGRTQSHITSNLEIYPAKRDS